MKNKQIDNLINDIMSLDPELKKYEKEIKKITNHLIESKPNLNIDNNFKIELKNTIMKKIAEIKNKEKQKTSFNWMIFSKKLAFSLGAIVLAIAIIIPLKNNYNKESKNLALNNTSFIRVEDGAFGKIPLNGSTQNTNNDNEISPSTEIDEKAVLGMGAGGNITISSDSRIMPYPYEPINYEFEYIGEDFELNGEKVDVYKKIKNTLEVDSIKDSIFNNNNIDLLNLQNFKDSSEISNISIKQDKKFGYIININPLEGSVSLYANWETWPQPFKDCIDDACYQRNRLKIDDVPENNEIIEVANKFISDNNISLDNYGEPIISYDFRKDYEENEDSFFVPDQISVVYPLILNDAEVVDNGGQKTGLFVSVDIREMKVYSINNLSLNNFEVSAYQALNDKNVILDYLKQGGLYPSYKNPEAKKTITVKIGSPEKTLVKIFKYNNTKGQSDEYYAPALSFPIIETDSDINYYRDNIIIPLAKDMIEDQVNIMPVLEMAR